MPADNLETDIVEIMYCRFVRHRQNSS